MLLLLFVYCLFTSDMSYLVVYQCVLVFEVVVVVVVVL